MCDGAWHGMWWEKLKSCRILFNAIQQYERIFGDMDMEVYGMLLSNMLYWYDFVAWYGLVMLWFGMVWYGMVWYGLWYGMVWFMVWCGAGWFVVWCGMVWYGMSYGVVWYGMVWYWCGVVGVVWCGAVWWYGMVLVSCGRVLRCVIPVGRFSGRNPGYLKVCTLLNTPLEA